MMPAKIIGFCLLIMTTALALHAQTEKTVSQIKGSFIYFGPKDSLFLESLSGKGTQTQLITVVFHAEKDTIGLDPGLSIDGRWRAIHLLQLMKPVKPQGFLTTPFRVNILTLQPLTDYFQNPVTYYDQADLKSFLNTIESYGNKPIMIVAHPETFGLIFASLTKSEYPESLAEPLSDRIIFIERQTNGNAKFWNFRYNIR